MILYFGRPAQHFNSWSKCAAENDSRDSQRRVWYHRIVPIDSMVLPTPYWHELKLRTSCSVV